MFHTFAISKKNNTEGMNTLLNEIWPYLLTAAVPTIGLYIGYIHQLRMKMAVVEKTLETLQRNQDNMQKRMDSHSKKQDEILDAISAMKLELVKQLAQTEKHISAITAEQAVIANEVKNINHSLSIIENK
jgi:uncharacterized membrane-anchored protein YhcB (DUF1043 family)